MVGEEASTLGVEGWSSAGSGEIPGGRLLFVLSWLVQDAQLSQKTL
jgi:hypothetical protein